MIESRPIFNGVLAAEALAMDAAETFGYAWVTEIGTAGKAINQRIYTVGASDRFAEVPNPDTAYGILSMYAADADYQTHTYRRAAYPKEFAPKKWERRAK